MHHQLSVLVRWLIPGILGLALSAAEPGPSPANHVYQFMSEQTFAQAGRKPFTTTGYLWLPPACRRVRGVLVFGQNVPEQGLAGDLTIRAACTDLDLGIFFACGSFRMPDLGADPALDPARKAAAHVAYLQQFMTALADTSGYAELASAPWLPIGESMSLQLVNMLASYAPERCLAAIQVKDGQWDRLLAADVPVLVATGTGAEWSQQQFDVATRWQEMAVNDLARHRAKRTATPAWPGSLAIEGGSAHFSCTAAMTGLIATYIRGIAAARLDPHDGAGLRRIDPASGFLMRPPVPDAPGLAPKPAVEATADERSLPWYPDRATAQAAYDLAAIDWHAQSPLPAFADAAGTPLPFTKRGIFQLPLQTEADGITFTLRATFLDRLPVDFVRGGSPLAHPAGDLRIEWLAGPFIPLGAGRFQIALDRSWNRTTNLFRAWHPGGDGFRLSVNPGALDLKPNQTGAAQTITFPELPDQPPGSTGLAVQATADSGLPVRFFVKAGPAEIHGDRLVFTPLPPRTRLPVAVTVVAWQWGRSSAPAIQTAACVERSFRLGVVR